MDLFNKRTNRFINEKNYGLWLRKLQVFIIIFICMFWLLIFICCLGPYNHPLQYYHCARSYCSVPPPSHLHHLLSFLCCVFRLPFNYFNNYCLFGCMSWGMCERGNIFINHKFVYYFWRVLGYLFMFFCTESHDCIHVLVLLLYFTQKRCSSHFNHNNNCA